MSCEKCEEFQAREGVSAFYRWKTANIEIRGCDEHLREIFDVLTEYQRKSTEGKPKPQTPTDFINALNKLGE